jgi:hypothetical protein
MFAACAALVMSGAMIAQTAVGLPRFQFRVDRNSVWATGSWIADAPGPIADYPAQTSELFCFRATQECTEARALVHQSPTRVSVMTLSYNVKRWTDTEVVAESDPTPTNTLRIRFDLSSQTVRMTESKIPPDVQKSRYDAHLGSGDEVDRRTRK